MVCQLTPAQEARMYEILRGIADDSNITHWHGFKHPLIARYNADAVFQLNNKERNIIQTHMWPLTITQLPRCREACLVCLADKMSSSWETLMERRAKREASHAARS